ncbi:unnamed protein product [Caenorhabditis bovis]|uniref:Carbohydrate kinase PfkB domain-containing protein n=1 Tax=Caenorhabditis bovis TaxID=2654633 RepID=A0A8S1EBD5_9PELO|nr:unnamed protein product [Caenorhabditis bovis]
MERHAIQPSEVLTEDGGSYPGKLIQRVGGVGRNHADALARLGCDSVLVSAVGNDSNAEFVRNSCKHINLCGLKTYSNAPTCTYLSINVGGNIKYGISTIEPLLHLVTPSLVTENKEHIENAEYVVLDANLPLPVMKETINIAEKCGKPVWFEPTDIKKVRAIFDCGGIDKIAAVSPNANEFLEWLKLCKIENIDGDVVKSPRRILELIEKEKEKVMKNVSIMVVSLAQNGTAVIHRDKFGLLTFKSIDAPVSPKEVVSVSGAGDSFNSGLLAGLLYGKSLDDSINVGQRCASATLQSVLAVAESLSPEFVE